jgi:excisionase family DNA binding protein
MTKAQVRSTKPTDESAAVAARALARVQEYLRTSPDEPARVRLVSERDGEDLVVPRDAVELLARILAHMASGHSVSVVPSHAELTTQEAANLLNVSRPYLIGLLESGEIGFRMVGTHRRVLAGSLVAYKARDDARRRDAADELTKLNQEMGLS